MPVFWVEGPAPLSATLKFRVGVRDETFRTCGITHMVEHLVMSTLGRRRHEYNASVDLTCTEFTASGRADLVSSYFSEICQALTSLPMERIPTEAKVLAAEGGSIEHPAVGEHLRQRFGLRNVGLAGVTPPAIDQLDSARVGEFAARHFTRGNAALALTGPPPDGLCIDLPVGTRSYPPPVQRLDLPLPMWFDLGGPAVAVSFLIDAASPADREAVLTTLRIAVDRAMDHLRHENGWLYDANFTVVGATREEVVGCFYADPPTMHAEDVRQGLLQILRDLRDVGPTDVELAEDLEAMREHLNDPRCADAAVSAAASAHLVGLPVVDPVERLQLREATTAIQCREVLRRLDETLIVGMPPDVSPGESNLTADLKFSAVAVSGRSYGRSVVRGWRAGVPSGTRLVVGDDGVTMTLPDGQLTVLWSDLVGVARDGSSVTLIGADGFMLSVEAGWFRHGDEALGAIERRIPPGLSFTTGAAPER